MADTQLTTRIILRNDKLSAWEKSESKLMDGEVVLAKRDDGSYAMAIGQNNKIWQDVSADVKISADQVIGLTQAMNGLSTKHYADLASENAMYELSDSYTLHNGDTAVVKTLIDGDKYSYKAFIYDTSLATPDWKAMDGNYNASNVYFDEDLTYTVAVGALSAVDKSGSSILAAKGVSLEDLLKKILAKEAAGSIKTNPSVTGTTLTAKVNGATAVTASQSYEYGTYLTDMAFSGATFNKGSYTYGPDSAQTVASWATTATNGVTVNTGATSTSGTLESICIGDQGADTDNDTLKSYKTVSSVQVTSTATVNADTVEANTNLGQTNTKGGFGKVQFAATSYKKESGTFSGYRNMFYGSFTAISALTSDNIRKLTAKVSGTYAQDKTYAASNAVNVNIIQGASQVIIAVPAKYKVTSVLDKNAFGTDIVGKFGTAKTVSVEGANGYTAISYNVYEWQPDAALDANTYNVTVTNV